MFNFPNCPLLPGAPVWAYLRDSGGDGQDLSSQRAYYVLGYGKPYRLKLARLFEDTAISGGSTFKQEEFELMIEPARRTDTPKLNSQFYKSNLRRGEIKAQQLVTDKTKTGIEFGRDRGRIHYRFPLSEGYLERVRGLEPLTSTLGRLRSTTELYPHQQAKL